MAMIGVTHDTDGRPKLRRAVTTKVAIGLPPGKDSNHPSRLDHFIFLKKVAGAQGEMAWAPDQDRIEHYGSTCREFWAVLLDNDVDKVFRTSYSAYVKTGLWCQGDGERARRKVIDPGTKLPIWKENWTPCANHNCPDLEAGKCAPSGDLYFMLNDYPALGSICRLHTSSYQSIREIYSSLVDLRQVSGGRLMGLKVKLTVRPEANAYERAGKRVTGTKWVVGLEIPADNLAQLSERMLETAAIFQNIQKQLAGQVLEVEEDDDDRADEIAAEFYPEAEKVTNVTSVTSPPAPTIEAPEMPRIRELMEKLGMNQARKDGAFQRFPDMKALLAKLESQFAQQLQNTPGFGQKPAAPAVIEARTSEPKMAPASNGAPKKAGFSF